MWARLGQNFETFNERVTFVERVLTVRPGSYYPTLQLRKRQKKRFFLRKTEKNFEWVSCPGKSAIKRCKQTVSCFLAFEIFWQRRLSARVTWLVEFSPNGWSFTLGSFIKITEVAQKVFLSTCILCSNFDKKIWLGYILGDFFTNSSGHPAFCICKSRSSILHQLVHRCGFAVTSCLRPDLRTRPNCNAMQMVSSGTYAID
jgi:hypothetical protein